MRRSPPKISHPDLTISPFLSQVVDKFLTSTDPYTKPTFLQLGGMVLIVRNLANGVPSERIRPDGGSEPNPWGATTNFVVFPNGLNVILVFVGAKYILGSGSAEKSPTTQFAGYFNVKPNSLFV